MSSSTTMQVKTPHRILSSILAFSMLTVGLVVATSVSVASASDPVVLLSASAPSSILAGEVAVISLSAENITSSDDVYNLSFSQELLPGVTYVSNSTSPSFLGNPRIVTVTTIPDPLLPLETVDNQVLIWANISDLISGSSFGFSFEVQADPLIYPVGSEFVGTSNAYANSDPRYVPKFNSSTGVATPGATSYTNSDTASSAPIRVSAIDIQKENPNPESELVRGVHSQTSTFTLTLRNTNQAATNDVVVVDYIPASLEFLSCGAEDNSTTGVEYSGAPGLFGTPVPSDCVIPYSVSTVSNPAGQPAGVYTRVEWRIGSLSTSDVYTITYAVGIPLYANTTTFIGGSPSATSLLQSSNLDNNNGASTRHIGDPVSHRNSVTATGEYTGALAPSALSTVTDTDSNSVRAMDLAITSNTDNDNFESGAVFSYILVVRTGEYSTSSAITVTDTVPDGVCPLVPLGTTVIGTLPTDCTAQGSVSGATIVSVTVNADGSFTTEFAIIPSTLLPNSTVEITYSALFRSTYEGGNSSPTASGDSFSTGSTITGTTTSEPATGVTPSVQLVNDVSGTSHRTSKPTIEKLVLPRTGIASTADCLAEYGNYVADTSVIPSSQFVIGDRVCFQLTVNFSTTLETRNSKIQDFVPVGTEYEGYIVGGIAEGSTLNPAEVSLPTGDSPTWSMGRTIGSDAVNLFVARGNVLTMFVSAIVVGPDLTDPNYTQPSQVDITANLMKYSQENTPGDVFAFRSQADFGVAPPATMALFKGIANLNGSANSQPYPTSAVVQGNQFADFSLTASNTGSALVGNEQTVTGYTVWDALPAPFDCATVSLISGSGSGLGVCEDNYTGFIGTAFEGQSSIIWNVTEDVPAGSSASELTYRISFPASGMSVGVDFTNNASITELSISSTSGSTSFYPENSLDESLTASWNTTEANADATVSTPSVSVSKSYLTPIVAPNNTAVNSVPGELVNYTYSVTIPAQTTVYNGALLDTLPNGLTNLPSTTNFTTVPNGVTTFSALTGYRTTFDSTYTNATDSPQTFTTNLVGVQVTPSFTGNSITNTASFRSDSAETGGTPLAQVTATATLPVVRPTPTVSKTVSSSSVASGQIVTYTLTVNNGAASPAGYDTIVNDCLPTGLTFLADVSLPAVITRDAPTAGTGTGAAGNGCANTTNLIRYNFGTLSPGSPVVVSFTATVDPSSAGLMSYTNTAQVITSTLSDGVRNTTSEAVITSGTGSATSTVIGSSVTKVTTKPLATIGETVPYVITVRIPAEVNFWKAAVIDTVPAGILLDQSTSVVECLTATLVDCMSDLPSGGSVMPATATRSGWYLGDITASSQVRTVRISLDSSVRDIPGNVIGGPLANVAQLSWMNSSSAAVPANAGSTFNRSTTVNSSSTAITTIQEPAMRITKSVDDSTIVVGQTFNYTVTATNGSNVNNSTAYNVTTTDTVPVGVIVDVASIPLGGTLAGNTPNGGGIITWTGLTVAPGASVVLTYSASLADSDTLTTAALINTARVTTYSSLAASGRLYTNPQPSATASVTPTFPRVTLTKTSPSGSIAYAGSSFSWRLGLANAIGSSQAVNTVATDILPENWVYDTNSAFVTFANGSVSQVEPSIAISGDTQTLTWNGVGAIGAGESATINYTATPSNAALVTPGVGSSSPHTNTFSATLEDNLGFTGNATSSYTSSAVTANAFIGSADLAVVKTSPGVLVAGSTTTNAWVIRVTNNGPGTAFGPFTITDDMASLPAGVTIGQPTGSGWTCTVPSAGDFTCARTNANNTLASGASFPNISIPTTVSNNVAAGTEINNSVEASARTFDPNLTNNSDSSTQTVTVSSDLSVVKTTSGAVNAGGIVTWTIVVNNAGPSAAGSPVTVTETLPAGVTEASASGTGWTCSAPASGEITCTMGSLVGTANTITVTASIPSSYVGSLLNEVEVTGINPDPTPGNNSDDTTDVVNTDTTVLIEKTLVGTEIVAGAVSAYSFTVTNVGRSDARNVLITDALPNGLVFSGSVISVTPGWTCAEVSSSPSTVECELAGALPATGADAATVSFEVTAPSDLPLDTIVENFATVSATNSPDDTDSALGTAVGVSDLGIEKLILPGAVVAGGSVDYTLEVTNNGDSDNNGVITVVDTLPLGLTLVSATGTDWTCTANAANRIVTCLYSSGLVSGASSLIALEALIAPSFAASTIYNQVTVSGDSSYTDGDASNNFDDVTTPVSTEAELTIVKTGASVLTPGTSTVYEISVTNDGPSNAANAVLTDVLPAGITGVSISGPASWACVDATLTCTISSLAPGTYLFTVTGAVSSSVPDSATLTNEAIVEWGDTAGRDNASDDHSGVTETIADLVLLKSASESTVNAAGSTTFDLLVQNNGPGDALGDITLTDTLPAGMSYTGASSIGGVWSCTPSQVDSQEINCILGGGAGVVAGGAAVLLTIAVQLDSDLGAVTLTNTATVSSPTTEVNLLNNTDDAEVLVRQIADMTVSEQLLAGTPRIGNALTFGYTARNNGPSVAESISVVVRMPAGLTNLEVSGSGLAWDCVIGATDSTGTEVTCTFTGALASGSSAPMFALSTLVGVASYPSFTNEVEVFTGTIESNYANNVDGITLSIPAIVGLNLTKNNQGIVQAGEQARYVLTVTNNGLTEAPNGFTVVDTLPASLSYESFQGEGVTCSSSSNIVTCVFSQVLAVGSTATVNLFVNVARGASGEIVNTASVSTSDENLSTSIVVAVNTVSVTDALPRTGAELTLVMIWLALLGILFGLILFVISPKRIQLA